MAIGRTHYTESKEIEIVAVENSCRNWFVPMWKDAGIGCRECGCNELGSESLQCNQDNGQCDCRLGYNGINCNQCSEGFWGTTVDGKMSCQKCQCNKFGSESLQCDQDNGQCQCKLGYNGNNCNQCSDEFNFGSADFPKCQSKPGKIK